MSETSRLVDSVEGDECEAAIAELDPEFSGDRDSSPDAALDSGFTETFAREGDLTASEDTTDFVQAFWMLVQPHNRVDVRREIIHGYQAFSQKQDFAQEMSPADVAAALTLSVWLDVPSASLIAEAGSEAAVLLQKLSSTKPGRKFVRRMVIIFRAANKMEDVTPHLCKPPVRLSVAPAADNQANETSAVSMDEHSSISDSIPASETPSEVIPVASQVRLVSLDDSSQPRPSAGIVLRPEDPQRSGAIMRRWLTDPNSKAEAQAIIREQPGLVLDMIQLGDDSLGLSATESASLVEMVVCEVEDDERAGELLEQHLTPARTVDFLARFGDRPMAVGHLVAPTIVLQALVRILREKNSEFKVESEDSAEDALSRDRILFEDCRGILVTQYVDRPDFEEMLALVVGRHQFGDYILAGILRDEISLRAAEEDSGMSVDPESDDSTEIESDEALAANADKEQEIVIPAVLARYYIQVSERDVSSLRNERFEEFGIQPEDGRARLLQLMNDLPDLTMLGFIQAVDESGNEIVEATATPQGQVEQLADLF